MEPNYRRCLGCRRIAHKREFLRIVRIHPSRNITLDQGIGRSAYICPQPDCLKSAQRKDRLGRALKAPVPAKLYEALWERLSHLEK